MMFLEMPRRWSCVLNSTFRPPRVRDDLAVEPLADNVLEEDLRALLESELAFGLRSPILLRWPLHGEG